jgi:CDP-alcohol phosphatidyltransferase-like enzyme
MSMSENDYKRSLKFPPSEEFLDLLFYRPVAFVLVKGIARLPVTPNQITMASLAAGLAAAAAFSSGSRAGLASGALLYAIANVLDCADGQLARLQQSGTLLGRVVDGAADYLSGIAVFIGLGIGLGSSGAPSWWLVAFAGISSGVQAMFFDRYQSEFIASAAGEPDFAEREAGRFRLEISRMRDEGREGIRLLLLQFYLGYLQAQKRFRRNDAADQPASGGQSASGRRMIRLWSLLGPTTNRTLLIVCALAGRIDIFLWSIAAGGNAWLLVSSLLQSRSRSRAAAAPTTASAGEGR